MKDFESAEARVADAARRLAEVETRKGTVGKLAEMLAKAGEQTRRDWNKEAQKFMPQFLGSGAQGLTSDVKDRRRLIEKEFGRRAGWAFQEAVREERRVHHAAAGSGNIEAARATRLGSLRTRAAAASARSSSALLTRVQRPSRVEEYKNHWTREAERKAGQNAEERAWAAGKAEESAWKDANALKTDAQVARQAALQAKSQARDAAIRAEESGGGPDSEQGQAAIEATVAAAVAAERAGVAEAKAADAFHAAEDAQYRATKARDDAREYKRTSHHERVQSAKRAIKAAKAAAKQAKLADKRAKAAARYGYFKEADRLQKIADALDRDAERAADYAAEKVGEVTNPPPGVTPKEAAPDSGVPGEPAPAPPEGTPTPGALRGLDAICGAPATCKHPECKDKCKADMKCVCSWKLKDTGDPGAADSSKGKASAGVDSPSGGGATAGAPEHGRTGGQMDGVMRPPGTVPSSPGDVSRSGQSQDESDAAGRPETDSVVQELSETIEDFVREFERSETVQDALHAYVRAHWKAFTMALREVGEGIDRASAAGEIAVGVVVNTLFASMLRTFGGEENRNWARQLDLDALGMAEELPKIFSDPKWKRRLTSAVDRVAGAATEVLSTAINAALKQSLARGGAVLALAKAAGVNVDDSGEVEEFMAGLREELRRQSAADISKAMQAFTARDDPIQDENAFREAGHSLAREGIKLLVGAAAAKVVGARVAAARGGGALADTSGGAGGLSGRAIDQVEAAEGSGARAFLGLGADAPAPSGPISSTLRKQFIRNAESAWFRAKADLAAAVRGEKIDWPAFMERLKSAEFREYGGLKEALKSIGYADKAASGEWLFGTAGVARRIPFLGDSIVQHELFHALQDTSYQLFSKRGFLLTLRAEGAASVIGSPLATTTVVGGSTAVGTTVGPYVADAIYPEGSR